MRYNMAADCAANVTLSVTLSLDKTLSPTALTLFRALHQVAVEAAEARGYVPSVSEVTLFCPAEQVARAVGISRATLYRVLPELTEAGLLDYRGHYCTYRGRTRSDGTVWAVRLRPVGGRKARLGYGDLKRQYRDLGGDIEAGRTSWQVLRQSKKLQKGQVDLEFIRAWAIPPQPSKSSLPFDCRMAPRRDLEAVLDVKHAAVKDRSPAVRLAAEALAAALRDQGGMNFYRRLLWQLLRRMDATGEDYSYQVYLAAQRAAVDASEGFARRAGALFVSRLKQAPWYEAVMRGPPVRVGVRPLVA